MSRIRRPASLVAASVIAVASFLGGAATTFAHARYDRSEPAAGSVVDGGPLVLRAWFTQELMLRSTIVVVDELGNQVDLADGRVDQDDAERKSMLVSLPALPVGVYTVQFVAASAEDGHDEAGSFAIGVGMTPPAAVGPAGPATVFAGS
jgi:copper resistance protein C